MYCHYASRSSGLFHQALVIVLMGVAAVVRVTLGARVFQVFWVCVGIVFKQNNVARV